MENTPEQEKLLQMRETATKEQLIEQIRKVIDESGTTVEFGEGLDEYVNQIATTTIENREQEKLSKQIVTDIEDEWAKEFPLIEETEKEFKKKQKDYYKYNHKMEKHWKKEEDMFALFDAKRKLQSPLKRKLLQIFIDIVCWNTRREMRKYQKTSDKTRGWGLKKEKAD